MSEQTSEREVVALVDLGSVRTERHGRAVTVYSGDVLLGLAVVSAGCSQAEAAFQALDYLSDRGSVQVADPDSGQWVSARLAWLNPFTSQVSVGSAEQGVVFASTGALLLPAPLCSAVVEGDVMRVGSSLAVRLSQEQLVHTAAALVLS